MTNVFLMMNGWLNASGQEIPIQVDLGFQGLHNEYVNIALPHKKPPKGELTEQQKQENREKSRSRVKCEHAFAGVKRYNAVAAVYSKSRA